LVELGISAGVSYSAFCHAVLQTGLATRCHAVGAGCGDRQVGETDDEDYEGFQRFHDRHYGKFSTFIRCVFDTALQRFTDGSIDLLHIDGRQARESARHDFECWLPKLSKRGICLLHSTNLRDGDFGVWRLWEELRGQYPSFEFLHGYGLGVLAVGETAPTAVLALCRLTDPAAIATLRNRFALLGERWSQVERLEASEIELEGLKTMAADRAKAAEMAENVAALKAGELQRTRAEIAALTARISSSSRIKRLCREAARLLLGSLKPHVAQPPVSRPGTTAGHPDRRS
jgi:hypothetical protein